MIKSTCLICDDFPANGYILKLLISNIKPEFNIDIVKSRPDLFTYLINHDPDIIFLDIIFGDNEEITPHINSIKKLCSSKIILYTGLPKSYVKEIMDKCSIEHVLYKPISKSAVEEILNRI